MKIYTDYQSANGLINTPLQHGDRALGSNVNRFGGFSHARQTAEGVEQVINRYPTPLEGSVNERVTAADRWRSRTFP